MKNKLEAQKRKLGKHLKAHEFYCSFPSHPSGDHLMIPLYRGVMLSPIAVTPQFAKDALTITYG